jgi:cytochrome b561
MSNMQNQVGTDLKHYRPLFRIWHWLNAVTIIGILGSVALRKSFLSYKTNAAIIQAELVRIDVDISLDAAKTIGRAIRAPMWEWHYLLGFALAALFLLRVLLHFTDRRFLPMVEFKKSPPAERARSVLYAFQYLLTALMLLSGFMIYFKEALGLSKDTIEAIQENHEIMMYFFAIFVPLHIIGVFVAENRDQPGIVSNMIGGE